MTARLLLLRHGEVASHRGDVPLTLQGRSQAEQAGRRLGESGPNSADVLVAPTIRAWQTGLELVRGLTESGSGLVAGPTVTSALRNPDLYLRGQRVEMVSTAAAFAEQVSGTSEADVIDLAFYADFLTSRDRIGCWLHHRDPPGDTAAAVAARIGEFVKDLSKAYADQAQLVVGVTHSPVLRALSLCYLRADPGEPGYLDGYSLRLRADGSLDLLPAAPSC